jgi:hypothetical protein
MRLRKPLLAAVALIVGLAVVVPATAASASSPGTSKVYITHGLPLDNAGTVVDVYAGPAGQIGKAGLLIDNFSFGTTAGPLELPAANYTVYLAAPTASDDGVLKPVEVIYQQDLAVPAGKNLSAVASFNASGSPQIAVFANDVSRAGWFQGRLSVRHAAAAPAVKVDVGLFPFNRFFPQFFTKTVGPAVNGQQADLTLPSFFRYDIGVKVAANNAFVDGVEKFKVDANTLTNVYAVGNPAKGTFQFVVQKIAL